jgi:hypothetical protein
LIYKQFDKINMYVYPISNISLLFIRDFVGVDFIVIETHI